MQQLQGQVPPTTPGATSWGSILADNISTVGTSFGTGATRMIQLSAQPTLARPWTVYGWAVQCKGLLTAPSGGGAIAGRLGKLLTSLIVGGSLTAANAGSFQPPPQDAMANLVTLWDGATDPPFPFLQSPSAIPVGGFVQTIQQLPQPARLNAGDQLGLGLWLTPMLASGQLSVSIYSVTYSVIYE